MADEVLVSCDNVSKKFCKDLKRSLWYGVQDICGELNPFHETNSASNTSKHSFLRKDEFWAVNDISFKLKRGECLGLIGHNGAGKSTLLKMLNGLIKPDKGKITMKGRIGALIELNAGFNPILTGRENVYIYGTILGFTKKEIDQKYDTIVEFAEMQEFMEMPFRSYSSGMKVRLGFAVAAQMEPDVLIIDEVLAVGDAGFRKKSMNKFIDLREKASIILVSHSIPTVTRIADKMLVLNKGKSLYLGYDKSEATKNYYVLHNINQKKVWEDGTIYDVTVETYDKENKKTFSFNNGDTIIIKVKLKTSSEPINSNINIIFTDKTDYNIAIIDSLPNFIQLSDEETITIRFKCVFAPGQYYLNLNINMTTKEKQTRRIYYASSATHIDVISSVLYGEIPVQLAGEWKQEPKRSAP